MAKGIENANLNQVTVQQIINKRAIFTFSKKFQTDPDMQKKISSFGDVTFLEISHDKATELMNANGSVLKTFYEVAELLGCPNPTYTFQFSIVKKNI